MSENQSAVAYDAINFDGTERRANYRTIAYREDILHICEHKDAAAILYQILYRWQTEVRRAMVLKEMEKRTKTGALPLTEEEAEDMMWVYMSYNDFVRESGGAVAYNTVIRMLEYLITTVNIVERRANHDPRYAGYEYRINKESVRERLKALAATPTYAPKVPKKKRNERGSSTHAGTAGNDSTHMGTRAQGLPRKGEHSTQKGRDSAQKGTGAYPLGETSHIDSHPPHRDSSQGDVMPVHVEDTHTPDALAQHIIQLDERRNRSADEAVASATGEYSAVSAQARGTWREEAGDGGDRKTVRTPELSTFTGTFPHSRAQAASGERASRHKAKESARATMPLSPEARLIFAAWCSLFTVAVPLTPAIAKAAEALVKPIAAWRPVLERTPAELLKEIMHWLYSTDKTGYYQRGVKLYDISREFEGWQSAKEREKSKVSRTGTTAATTGDVFWQGRWMSYAEADAHGWNGGFGEFVQHTHYARSR